MEFKGYSHDERLRQPQRGLRAGKNDNTDTLFLLQNVVVIGWTGMDALSCLPTFARHQRRNFIRPKSVISGPSQDNGAGMDF